MGQRTSTQVKAYFPWPGKILGKICNKDGNRHTEPPDSPRRVDWRGATSETHRLTHVFAVRVISHFGALPHRVFVLAVSVGQQFLGPCPREFFADPELGQDQVEAGDNAVTLCDLSVTQKAMRKTVYAVSEMASNRLGKHCYL